MSKTTILCATALLVLFGCKQSENVNTTSSSETTSTLSTTATAPVTDTSATTMTAGTTTESVAPTETTATTATSPATTTSSGSARRETKKTTGPVVTETVSPSGAVSLPKNPPPPPKATEPETKSTTTSESKASSASLASTGQTIFKAQCTACHGADASGNTPIGKKNNIPDFRSAAVQNLSDAELANVIANGKGPISSSAHKSKHLSSDQISAVVAYIRSLK